MPPRRPKRLRQTLLVCFRSCALTLSQHKPKAGAFADKSKSKVATALANGSEALAAETQTKKSEVAVKRDPARQSSRALPDAKVPSGSHRTADRAADRAAEKAADRANTKVAAAVKKEADANGALKENGPQLQDAPSKQERPSAEKVDCSL